MGVASSRLSSGGGPTFLIVLVEDEGLGAVAQDFGVAGVPLVRLGAHVDGLRGGLDLENGQRHIHGLAPSVKCERFLFIL